MRESQRREKGISVVFGDVVLLALAWMHMTRNPPRVFLTMGLTRRSLGERFPTTTIWGGDGWLVAEHIIGIVSG